MNISHTLDNLRARRACAALALSQMTAIPRLLSSGDGGSSDTTAESIVQARDEIAQLDRLIASMDGA